MRWVFALPVSRRNSAIIAGAILLVILAIVAWLSFSPSRKMMPANAEEALLVERAVARQAGYEGMGVEEARSSYDVEVRRYPDKTCIDLKSTSINVSSSYCFRPRGRDWELISERNQTI
jgi:uncharacterized membrane protein YqiK